MFGLSFTEFLVVAIVGVIVIGPEDVPKVVATVVRFFRALRSIGGEIKAEMAAIVQDEKLDALAKDLDARYIIDDEGRRQRVYDISDVLEKEDDAMTR